MGLIGPVNPFSHRRYPDSFFTPLVVRELLLLVSVDVPLADVQSWTNSQRIVAGDWALRTHLRASDNNTVRVPEKPSFIPDFRPMDSACGSVMEL